MTFRSRLATSGLVFAAILFAVLFNIQAGFFHPMPEAQDSYAQGSETPEPPEAEPKPAPKSALDTEEQTNPAEFPQASTDKSQADSATLGASNCTSEARNGAKSAYDEDMADETKRHEKQLASVGKLSKLIHKLTFSQTKDPASEENEHHRKAIQTIKDRYSAALDALGCQKQPS
jgi:hypothetical protein